jgi:hypothetical protein
MAFTASASTQHAAGEIEKPYTTVVEISPPNQNKLKSKLIEHPNQSNTLQVQRVIRFFINMSSAPIFKPLANEPGEITLAPCSIRPVQEGLVDPEHS